MPHLIRLVLARALVPVLLLAASPSWAGPSQNTKPKLAIFDVRAVGAFDAKTVAGLSALIASEASRFPFRVVAGSDLAALMNLDRQKQMLGCTDSSCLAELGGALGVKYMLSSEVSEIGGVWLVSLTLLDVARSNAVGRITRRTSSQAGLVDTATDAVSKLLAPLARELAPSAASVPTERADREVPAQPEPGSGGGSTAGYWVGAGGIALLAGGVLVGLSGRSQFQEAQRLGNEGDASRYQQFVDARDGAATSFLVADVLYGASAVCLAGGIYLLLTGGDDEPGDAVSVGFSPSRAGGAVVISGGF